MGITHTENVTFNTRRSTWVRLVSMLRIPEDVGVGDTLKRIFDLFGGDRFKRFAARIGVPCGCADRQEFYNETYPY